MGPRNAYVLLCFGGFLTTCKTVENGYSLGACVGRFSPRVEEGLLGQRSIPTLPPLDVTLLRLRETSHVKGCFETQQKPKVTTQLLTSAPSAPHNTGHF